MSYAVLEKDYPEAGSPHPSSTGSFFVGLAQTGFSRPRLLVSVRAKISLVPDDDRATDRGTTR